MSAQVSEIDGVSGEVLCTYADVTWPYYLSVDTAGDILVADCYEDDILLLNSRLQLQQVFHDINSEVQLWWPTRLCYSEATSQLYILHSSSSDWSRSHVVSLFNVQPVA